MSEFTFFVDPSINQGWEHECYIAKGSISIVSTFDSSQRMQADIPKGTKDITMEWGFLKPGVYIISYLLDGKIIDNKKND